MLNKTFYFVALPVAMLTCGTALAQDVKKERKEIIIREGSDSTKKMVIVVNGDKVLVNGKEVTGDEKSNFIIKKSKSADGKKVNVEVSTIDSVKTQAFVTIGDKTIVTDDKADPSLSPKNIRIHKKIIKDGKVIEETEGPAGFMEGGFPQEFQMIIDDKMGEGKLALPGAQLGVLTAANEKGAEIKEVKEGTAAAKAGFKEGDIITRVDGQKIAGPEELVAAIRSKKPGDEVTIGYIRSEKNESVNVKLGKVEGMTIARSFSMPMENVNPELFDMKIGQEGFPHAFTFQNPKAPRPKLGLEIQDIEDGKGVKVLNVLPDMPAAKSGLKKDDIILSIGSEKISDVDEARKALKELEGLTKLQVKRGSQILDIELKVPKPLKKASL